MEIRVALLGVRDVQFYPAGVREYWLDLGEEWAYFISRSVGADHELVSFLNAIVEQTCCLENFETGRCVYV